MSTEVKFQKPSGTKLGRSMQEGVQVRPQGGQVSS